MAASDLIMAQQRHLELIAGDWLTLGATSFSIWLDDSAVLAWPGDLVLEPFALRVPLTYDAQILELRITGLDGQTARERLHMDARWLVRVLKLEDELQQMTAGMIEMQDQLLAMYDLSQATRDHLDVHTTLQRLAREFAHVLKAERVVFGLAPNTVQYPARDTTEPWVITALQRGQAHGRDLIMHDSDQLPAGVSNYCVLPFQVRGIPAALALINRMGGFTAPDLKLARAITEQAATQLEHTLLYEQSLSQAKAHAEMEIARRVQLQLLPQQLPHIPDLDLFAESRPALQVGGDFYDVVAEPARPLMLLLGDVVGKGISAALIMGIIHTITRNTMRFMPLVTPAAVLRRATHDLYDDLTMLEAFATVFVAQYDPNSRVLHYANAGHAPVIYRPPGGHAQLIEGDGVPVGVLIESLSENYTLAFGPDALLVVTTDGFNEARNPDGSYFGIEQLLELVDQVADQPAHLIARSLFEAVDTFVDGHLQEDDQTLIVIKGRSS